MSTFGEAYAAYADDERKAVVSLIAEIYRQTKHPAFSKLASDLAQLFLKIGPALTSGKGAATLVLAIDSYAPALSRSLALALGSGIWQGEIDDAIKQALR